MTANATYNEFKAIEAKASEDAKTIATVTNILKEEFVSFYPSNIDIEDAKETAQQIEKVFNLTNMSIKMYSTSYYKKHASLDTLELEQIKKALENFKNNNQKVESFKRVLIEDLEKFQKQIRANHTQKIATLAKEKQLLERQLFTLNLEKNRLIMDRLSKIVWPYDEKTKQYTSKIAATETRIAQYENKIGELELYRPMANEKDVLLYQMQLKEKFARK